MKTIAAPSSARWLPTLSAILLVQTTCAYLTRLIPTLAPLLMAEIGLNDTAIGYMSAANMAGSIGFLVLGSPLIRRYGPLRTLQFGLIIGLVGLIAMATPFVLALGLASFLIGVGYAPSAPAGNEVLHRFAPPARRTMIFSIKQAGVPLGGVLAGLVLPSLSNAYGWQGGLWFSAAIVVLTIVVVQPMRESTDVFRDPEVPVSLRHLFGLKNLTGPLRVIAANGDLRNVALVGSAFAVGQGAWLTFLVTMGVTHLGLDFAAAGLLFAIMQATGIFGRVLLGWFADWLGSGRLTLQIVAVTSALSSLVLALLAPGWNFAALSGLAAIAGITVSSWNGVQMAEVARLAPKDRIAEASAGATIVIFLGYIVGPLLVSGILATTGRYDVAFVGIAVVTLLALFGLRGR